MSGSDDERDAKVDAGDVCATNDEARKIVLARRARFIAAAVAGVGIACSDPKRPEPCLSPIPEQPDPGPGPDVCLSVSPQPCLEPMPPPDAGAPDAADSNPPAPADAGAPAPADAPSAKPPGKTPATGPTHPPRPCLKVAPKKR